MIQYKTKESYTTYHIATEYISEIPCQHEHILRNNPQVFIKMGTLW